MSRSARPSQNEGSRAMRIPLELTIVYRMGRARTASATSKKPRVQGRLAAGEHRHVGLAALRADQAVGHGPNVLERGVPHVGVTGEAGWTLQVAGLRDLEHGDAGVLLVLRAEPAVVGAAVHGLRGRVGGVPAGA